MKNEIIIRRAKKEREKVDKIYSCFATTAKGVESLAADELSKIGIEEIKTSVGGVYFKGDREKLYKANLWLRTASRILVNLLEFKAETPEELYNAVYSIDWQNYLNSSKSFVVDCNLKNSAMTHSGFAALKTKDAVVDKIRNLCGDRPDVDKSNPDIRINLHINNNHAVLSLDSSETPLDRRGYRRERNEAPLRETLAASIIMLTEWDGKVPLYDPMCGSGTIPLEAVLMAKNIPPGLNRGFGFEKWLDFDRELWRGLVADAKASILPIKKELIHGYDIDEKGIAIAKRNAINASVLDSLKFEVADVEDFNPQDGGGVVIINPPYGKRLGDEESLKILYKRIGDLMKQRCQGMTGYLLTGNMELAKYVGLKASRRYVLYNGAIECRLLKYEMY